MDHLDPQPEQTILRVSDLHNMKDAAMDSTGNLQFIRDESRGAKKRIVKELIPLQCKPRKLKNHKPL